jgi:hypothetical protein
MSEKIHPLANQNFNISFRILVDGRIDYVIVKPDLCSASGQVSNLVSLYKRLEQIMTDYAITLAFMKNEKEFCP